MWIDRMEERINEQLSKLPYPTAWMGAGVLLIVVLLVSFGSVAQSQVSRSHDRMAGVTAMRTELVQCANLASAMAVDNCRSKVLVAYLPADRAPRSGKPNWPDAGTSPLQTGAFQPADAVFVPVPLPVTQVSTRPLL